MSGLDVDKFNLFAKKTNPNKPAQKPVPVPVTSPEVVEEEIKKFEQETIANDMGMSADSQVLAPNAFSVEIERFDDSRPAVQDNVVSVRPKVVERTTETTTTTLRKFETFAAPTFRIPQDHDFELKRIEQTIMRNRRRGTNNQNRERITSNTVVRALLANFLERVGDMDLSNIDNEEMLKERMERVFKQKYRK